MLQNARLISGLVGYGPCPTLGTPVEQRLTVSASGRIWFTEYVAGEEFSDKPMIGRKLQRNIGAEKAQSILSLLEQFGDSKPDLLLAMDTGDWILTLTDTNGQRSKLTCSMGGNIAFHDVKLSGFLRQEIPIDDLAAFG